LVDSNTIHDPETRLGLKYFTGQSLNEVLKGLSGYGIHKNDIGNSNDVLYFKYKDTMLQIPKLVLHNYDYKVVIQWLKDTNVIEDYKVSTYDGMYITASDYGYGNLTITGSYDCNNIITSGSCSKPKNIYQELVDNFNSWIKK
jgi:hypothetical protein